MPEIIPEIQLIDTLFQGASGSIATYLLRGVGGENILIESGPSTTRQTLLSTLRASGIDPASISTIIVTHIHLDHSGGAGVLLRNDLPHARVLVHPLGRPHLIDPEKLIRSATRLYGDLMEQLWGEVAPIPEERVIALPDGEVLSLAGHELEVLYTPGHAAHHLSLYHRASKTLFTGDAAGVCVPGIPLVNPPTVPPEFDPEAWERTIERMQELDPAVLLLTHFGAQHDPRAHLVLLRQRLHAWLEFVTAQLATGQSPAEVAEVLRTHDTDLLEEDAPAKPLRSLQLASSYEVSVAGMARYLSKRTTA